MNNPANPPSGGDGTPVPPRKGRKGSRPEPIAPPSKGKGKGSAGNKGGNKSGGGAKSGPGSKGGSQRASAARQARRRRNRFASVAVTGVVAVVAVVVAIGLSSTSSSSAAPRLPVPANLATQLTTVNIGDLVAASARAGSALNPATELSAPAYTEDNKPELLFIGAEFCPICATERWPMAVALSHFGTFSNLHQTRSAKRDSNIATLSFYGSTYTSPYLTFTPVETLTNIPKGNGYVPLQNLTNAQSTLWDVVSKDVGVSVGYPFVYFGGKLVLDTAQFSPDDLLGKNFTQIANDVGNNDTTIGADIDASAAAFTKYLCTMTGDKPSSVCNAVATVNAPLSQTSTGTNTPATG